MYQLLSIGAFQRAEPELHTSYELEQVVVVCVCVYACDLCDLCVCVCGPSQEM